MKTYTENDAAAAKEDIRTNKGEKRFNMTYIGLGVTYSNWDQQVRNLPPTKLAEYQAWVAQDAETPIKHRLMNYLVDKLMEKRVGQVMVAQENHEDGSIHFHAYVNFIIQDGKYIRQDYLDLFGIHPNIEQLENKHAWVAYINKQDKDLVQFFEVLDLTDY